MGRTGGALRVQLLVQERKTRAHGACQVFGTEKGHGLHRCCAAGRCSCRCT